jgi:hypothetical protein
MVNGNDEDRQRDKQRDRQRDKQAERKREREREKLHSIPTATKRSTTKGKHYMMLTCNCNYKKALSQQRGGGFVLLRFDSSRHD